MARHFALGGLRLSRRSLIAAAGVLASAGPGAVGKALAFSSSKPTKIHWADGNKHGDPCHSKCVMCFLSGTHLLTSDGEIPIEKLKIADPVVTESGATRSVRWIGRLTIDRADDGHWPDSSEPVRIATDAFGPRIPHRDLYLSRAHMVYLHGVLLPVGDLINGRTVAPANVDADRLSYFHIEFDTHDIVLADGAPCESLRLEPSKLWSFDNWGEYLALFGHPPKEPMAPYAPIAAYHGGRGELKSRLRSALAPLVDFRRPGDVVRDALEARALL